MAHAQELTLPKVGSDPVVLRVLDGTPRPDMLEVTLRGAERPIAGRYTVDGDTISFAPAFGFDEGQAYVVVLPKEGEAVPFHISPSKPRLEATVTDVYPSGDVLPENSLRFYIHFSVPMQPHVAFDYIKLRDAKGAADEAALMRFKQEL